MTDEEKWEAAKAAIASNITNPKPKSDFVIIDYNEELWKMARITKAIRILPEWAIRGWWLCGDGISNPSASLEELALLWQEEIRNDIVNLGWVLNSDTEIHNSSWEYDLLVFGKC